MGFQEALLWVSLVLLKCGPPGLPHLWAPFVSIQFVSAQTWPSRRPTLVLWVSPALCSKHSNVDLQDSHIYEGDLKVLNS